MCPHQIHLISTKHLFGAFFVKPLDYISWIGSKRLVASLSFSSTHSDHKLTFISQCRTGALRLEKARKMNRLPSHNALKPRNLLHFKHKEKPSYWIQQCHRVFQLQKAQLDFSFLYVGSNFPLVKLITGSAEAQAPAAPHARNDRGSQMNQCSTFMSFCCGNSIFVWT